jgi:sarcosine oxidase subunit alpha
LTIFFDGKPIEVHEGDTIAAALYRAGVRIFTRSFKYHRPRGLLCCAGRCPNCLMNVDGVPNVRACIEPVRDGMRVRHQNAFPSLESDVLSVIETFGDFLPVGFYYKTFLNKHYWHAAEPLIRRIAGLGVIESHSSLITHHSSGYEHQYLHTDVVVIGGGPAGMSAALEAARAGASVMLIDEQPELGGHLRTQTQPYENVGEYSGSSGVEIARRLAAAVNAAENITVLRDAMAFGCYEGLLLGVVQGKRLIHLRTKRLVVATGAYEYPFVFRNNDLPGVMLGSGAQRLIHLHHIKPGNRAVVVTNNDFGLTVAHDLSEVGVEVAAIVDTRKGQTIIEAMGHKQVTGALIANVGEDGKVVAGTEREIPCDLICLSTGFTAANGLLYQSGCTLEFDETSGMFVPTNFAPNVYAAGDVLGMRGLAACLDEGRAAGAQAAREGEAPAEPAGSAGASPSLSPQPSTLPDYRLFGKFFVCLCMDVTEKDIRDAVAEGFDEMELLKRYATVGMGPCQGKMCGMACIAACAQATGRTMAETGTTTSRQPIQPVTLGALAGASHHPIKLTPMHHKHVALGAQMMDMGEWKRPLLYESVTGEYRAVRERVGLIDVSTLGKLDVKGKDAGRLLDKVYTHVFSNLRVGRTRYGVICDDAGIILDDGTVTRLADDHYFITTTTGNVEFVEQWLGWWAAGTGMCVHVTNVTAGYAAVNLAGPRARETLSKLTDADLSSQAFPYMASAQATVAGVPCLLLRIGFVGEMGWEIHFPAEYGESLWDALMDAGKEFGIAPFGVETQRVLRLEKKHVIVGVDTDALSNPLEADMAWVVRWEKPDFIGKRSLLHIRERGLRNKLVGFTVREATVPEDGCAIVNSGSIIGRVASCRLSPHVGSAVGFAWVPMEQAADGTRLHIVVNGRIAVAEVVSAAFYDPEGYRLRG